MKLSRRIYKQAITNLSAMMVEFITTALYYEDEDDLNDWLTKELNDIDHHIRHKVRKGLVDKPRVKEEEIK